MKTPASPDGKTSAPEHGDSKAPAEFLGTSNPRLLRIIDALMVRPHTREETDRIAGASNGPAAIAELRGLGLPAPECLLCELVSGFDRDGQKVKHGVYSLTPAGRERVNAWRRKRDAAGGANA